MPAPAVLPLLREHMGKVLLDCVDADAEPLSDLLVGHVTVHQRQHLVLSRGQSHCRRYRTGRRPPAGCLQSQHRQIKRLQHRTREAQGACQHGIQRLRELLCARGPLDAAARLSGGELEIKHNYGGWRPNLDSPALAAARTAYENQFGEPPIVTAVHAGLESAVIGDKVPGLDMLSFGPQIEFPHSPDERVSIPTVERFWRLLVVFLDEMSDPAK